MPSDIRVIALSLWFLNFSQNREIPLNCIN